MQNQVIANPACHKRVPWNKGKLTGAKPPLRPKHVWSIRTKLQIEGRARDPSGRWAKQLTALLDLTAKSDRIERVINYIEELAAVAGLSPRQFSRIFRRKPVNRRQRRSNNFDWKPPGS